MDQPREGHPIISSTTVRVNKRTRTDVAQESLASIQEDLKRTFTAYTSFRDRRADVTEHLYGKILKESQIPGQASSLVAETSNDPDADLSLLSDTHCVPPSDTCPPRDETSSQPIETFGSLFYPTATDNSLVNSDVIHIQEEYLNPNLPGGMEKRVLEGDPEEPSWNFENFVENEYYDSGQITPTPSFHEDGFSQATESSQTSSFPFEASLTPTSSVINTFFPQLSKLGIAKSVKKRGFYSNDNGWIDWPNESLFANMTPGSRKERLIAKKLAPLLNAIIDIVQKRHPLSKVKMFALDGQDNPVYNRDGRTYLKPDIFICGTGPCFSSTSESFETSGYEALRQWAYCIYPVEIKTDSQRRRELDQVLSQMGTYVREVFAAQPNRRFVPSLIFTERTVEFLFWDRGGVLISEKMDYHTHPVSFCNIFASLVEWEDEERGFDPYLKVVNGVWKMQMSNSEENFILVAKYFHPYTIFGRTVVCWRGIYAGSDDEAVETRSRTRRNLTDEERHVLIQDAWLPYKQVSFLEDILKNLGPVLKDIPGLIQAVRLERVQKLDGQTFDSIRVNRKNLLFRGDSTLCHIRIISVCQKTCIPLDMITRAGDVWGAFQDIVAGLRRLYESYGYIQNDIKPWTILVQPGANGRQKGVLLNLYSLQKAPEHRDRKREPMSNNSILFESQNIWRHLPLSTVNDHLDGILSCYYVLCFIVGRTTKGPELSDDQALALTVRPDLAIWERGTAEEVAESKSGHFTGLKFFKAQPGWGPSVDALLFSLHRFFHRRIRILSIPLLDAKTPEENIAIMEKFASNPVPSSLTKEIIKRDFDAIENCW